MTMTQDHKDFLDELRESGITNMWAAPSYLMEEFNLTKQEARIIFQQWIESFED